MLKGSNTHMSRKAADAPINPLRFARRWAGMSQADLAAASGVSLRTIQSLDRGDTAGCQLSTARAIALALGHTVEELFPAYLHIRP